MIKKKTSKAAFIVFNSFEQGCILYIYIYILIRINFMIKLIF